MEMHAFLVCALHRRSAAEGNTIRGGDGKDEGKENAGVAAGSVGLLDGQRRLGGGLDVSELLCGQHGKFLLKLRRGETAKQRRHVPSMQHNCMADRDPDAQHGTRPQAHDHP